MVTLTKTKKTVKPGLEKLLALTERLKQESSSPDRLPETESSGEPIEEITSSETTPDPITESPVAPLEETIPPEPTPEPTPDPITESPVEPLEETTPPEPPKPPPSKWAGMPDLTGTGFDHRKVKTAPPTGLERLQALKDKAIQDQENRKYGTISFGKLYGIKDYALATVNIMNESIAGGFDLPYDFTMGFVNQILYKTGLDKQIGTVKLGNFKKLFRAYGITFSPEMHEKIELTYPHLTAIADFMGFSLAALPYESAIAFKYMSRPVYTALRKRFPGEPSLDTALTKLRNALPFLKKAKISPYAPSTTEAFKKGFGEIGKTMVRSPFKTLARDLTISGGAGMGYQFFKDLSDDDPMSTWIGSMATAVTFMGALKSLEMTASVTYSVVRSLMGIKGTGAELRAANRIADMGGGNIRNELDELIIRLENPDGEEYMILQEVWDAMSPAQKAGTGRELTALEKTILSYDTSLEKAGNEQLARLQEILYKSFSLAGNNRSPLKSMTLQAKGFQGETSEFFGESLLGDIKFTRENFTTQLKYLDTLVEARWLIAVKNYEAAIKKLKPSHTKAKSSEIARAEVEAAYKDMRDTNKMLWAAVDLDKTVSISPIVEIWKSILSTRSRAADPEELYFSSPSQDRDRLLKELGHFELGNWIPGIAEAQHNGQVSLKVLQDIRSRVLDELKDMAKRPNQKKQRIFNDIQEAIINTFKVEETKMQMMKDPETGEFLPEAEQLKGIFTAISHSSRLHDKYQDGIIKEILGPTTKSRTGVDPRLTFKVLLKPDSAEEKVINLEELFEAIKLERDPALRLYQDSAKPHDEVEIVTIALTSYLKHNFKKDFLSRDKTKIIDGDKAVKWLEEHRHLLKYVPDFKSEIKEAIITGDALKLRTAKTKRAKEYLYNSDKNLLVLILKEEPENVFNWTSSQYIKDIPVSDLNGISQVMKKLALKAAKDPTGSATLGLQQSVFQWMLRKSLVEENGIKVLSGSKLTRLLNEEKTNIIISTFLTEQQKAKLRVFQITAIELDGIRSASPLVDKKGAMQSISGDTTGWILDFVGKVMGADLGRRFQRNFLGGGTIQTPGAFSKQMRVMLKDLDIDFAEKLLIEAFTSDKSKDFSVLLRKLNTSENIIEFDRYFNSFIVALATKYNLPFPYTDDLGNMEGEDMAEGYDLKLEKEEEEPTEIP